MKAIYLKRYFFLRLIVFAFALVLQACSSTPIGDRLAASFDSPEKTEIDIKGLEIKESLDNLSRKKIINKAKPKSKDLLNKDVLKNEIQVNKNNKVVKIEKPNKNKSALKVISKKYKPQPYRIILRLSAANPSAPAETVTEALREAGIEFEVERIERFNFKGNLNDSPSKENKF